MIRSIGHDPETNTLEVEFKSGGTYQYQGVSADEHGSLITAPSVGKYFLQNIKGNYESSRIE